MPITNFLHNFLNVTYHSLQYICQAIYASCIHIRNQEVEIIRLQLIRIRNTARQSIFYSSDRNQQLYCEAFFFTARDVLPYGEAAVCEKHTNCFWVLSYFYLTFVSVEVYSLLPREDVSRVERIEFLDEKELLRQGLVILVIFFQENILKIIDNEKVPTPQKYI